MALLVELLSPEALEKLAGQSENEGTVDDRADVIAARAELVRRNAARCESEAFPQARFELDEREWFAAWEENTGTTEQRAAAIARRARLAQELATKRQDSDNDKGR